MDSMIFIVPGMNTLRRAYTLRTYTLYIQGIYAKEWEVLGAI